MTEESLTVDQEVQTQQEETQEIENQPVEQTETDSGDTPESEDEMFVTIGEEAPPQTQEDDFEGQPAPQWVKDLRKSEKELKRELRELKQAQSQAQETKQTEQEIVLGDRPRIDDEDIDYDQNLLDRRLDEWLEKKVKFDQQQSKKAAEQESQQQAWQGVLNSYGEKKAALKVKDFDDAEFAVTEKMDNNQQAIMLQAMDNPALVVYALGKSQARLEELSKIKDPIKFAVAVAKLETQLKTGTRKAATAPERKVTSNSSISGTHDSTLERLRQDAEKTGDYSKVTAYKRQSRK
jgi:hypothetical protein